jgi:[acyl-carrier-protein] S-malonyltransferase
LSAHLGRPWREGLGDPAWLHANRVAQLLLTGVGIAAWQVLAARLPRPVAVAGYSVGELAAFAVAGVFDAGAALDLAAARAQAMTDSVGGRPTGLMAVQGAHALSLAGPEADLSVAIRIGAQRVIVGGPAEVLDDAARRWSGAGLRCTRLPIGVASHTPAMKVAAAAFAQRLAAVTLHPARSPVVCNFTGGTSRSLAVLAPALAGQIASTVRWDDCMDSIAERGVHCVLEVGPGTTLAAMWRERHPHLPVRSVDEFQGPEGVLRWVAQQPA